MGDRASIRFKQGGHYSPTLCNHWGGREFFQDATRYLLEVCHEKRYNDPIFRLEPGHLMVDFIAWYSEDNNTESCYIESDPAMVDDSDNGRADIDVDEFLKDFERKWGKREGK